MVVGRTHRMMLAASLVVLGAGLSVLATQNDTPQANQPASIEEHEHGVDSPSVAASAQHGTEHGAVPGEHAAESDSPSAAASVHAEPENVTVANEVAADVPAQQELYQRPQLTEFVRPKFEEINKQASLQGFTRSGIGSEVSGDGSVLSQVVGGLALGAIVITLLVAARTSRLKTASGAKVRALTVSTKLVLAFGTMTFVVLALGTLSLRSLSSIANAQARGAHLAEQTREVIALGSDLRDCLAATSRFTSDNTAENYKAIARAHAATQARIALLRTLCESTANKGAMDEVAAHLATMDGGMVETVQLHDQRTAIFQSQLLPTVIHINKLLTILEQATAQDAGLRGEIVRTQIDMHQSRTAMYRYLVSSAESDAEEAQSLSQAAASRLENAAGKVKSEGVKGVLAEVGEAIKFWEDRLFRLDVVSGKRDAARSERVDGPAKSCEEGIQTLIASLKNEQAEAAAHVASVCRSSAMQIGIAIAVSALVAVLACTALIRYFDHALRPVLHTLAGVSKGDLTVQTINSSALDELGEVSRAVDAMVHSVKDVLSEVSASTHDVSAAATEIAASAEEMSSSVGEVARQAQQAAKAAEQAGGAARSGGDVVSKTVTSMQKIHTSVEATAKNITELGERSEEIGRVIEVINSIAEQTNLLALNAAIEAARAGVHGRGFAVVADEVRKLAERTSKATEEVTTSIEAIQSQTHQAVTAMFEGTKLVGGGVAFASEAKSNLESIVGGASTVASMIKSITTAGEEAGAGASQSAAAAGQLSAKAEELRVMVGRFRIA